ncbi:MAG TPA: cyclic beta 1-2 glucan synthetase, partial [Lacipirellulaceae bacterium]|nr:cyclic beta 1-2 glucan synthetase [Lacipirellulaceae bacterium]
RRHDPPHRRAPLEEPAPRLVRLVETPHGGDSAVPLQFDNGLGGFAADGREYVLRLRPDSAGRLRLPPTPWSHVVANPQAGFIATETGGGSSWTVNSRENRLTVWANDPVSDPPSETIYLCDRARGAYWSPTPAPAGPGVEHEVRYAFGSVQYRQTSAALRQTVQQFVPCDDPVKMTRLVLENQTHQPRELDVYYFAHLALGHGGADQRRGVRTWFDEASGLLLAVNERRTLGDRVAFAAIVAPGQPTERTWTGDREEFLGRYGEPSAPAAVAAGAALAGRGGAGLDACAALQMRLLVPAEGAATCWMLLGEAYDEEAARQLAARYQTAAAVDGALAEVRNFWDEALSAVQVETPSPALDVMVNGWLPYQDLCCRLWARSAYYQGGGAFGFRDQLQDAAALTYHDPAITRTQILRHAAAQFVEGDVLHWWHPPDSRGVRTRFADDLLWLPWVAAEYAATTGDEGIWDEPTP